MLTKIKPSSIIIITLLSQSTNPSTRVLKYNHFQLSYNCEERTTDRFEYTLASDSFSAKRPSSYTTDPNLDPSCGQQFKTSPYGRGYDRGHLVTSNHMDFDKGSMKQANYFTNIVPQISSFNQGIWQITEEITDCYRDINPISVYGGVVYTDSSNDIFLKDWGIKTPDFMWKVLLTKDLEGRDLTIAWYFPNVDGLVDLDLYIVSIGEIEEKLNDGLGEIPVLRSLKLYKATTSWIIPVDCDRS